MSNGTTSKERALVDKFQSIIATGRAFVEITRADGSVQTHEIKNQELANGLNELALQSVNSRQLFNWIAVGTETAVASLGSSWAGEVSRKQGATLTTSKMAMILVATWGGAADSVTSVALETATIVNHADSGSGVPLNILTGVAFTAADSDLLKLQMEFKIGSHDL